MLENQSMENLALNFVKAQIQNYDYDYADLSCDRNGVDLFAFKNLGKDNVKIIKVQSKGRNITDKNSNVRIYQHYVTNDFVCFLYLKTRDKDSQYLYLFFHDDIVKWTRKKGKDDEHHTYELYIGKNFIKDNHQYLFNSERAKLLDKLFDQQEYTVKPRCFDHTSLLHSFYNLWCDYGIRPDMNALRIIDDDCDVINYNERIGIFFACMNVVLDDDDELCGIDWLVGYIKNFIFYNEIDQSLVINTGKSYSSNYRITYSAFVEEIEYGKDSGVNGFHLYIGDHEEKYDIYLLRDGRYGIIKKL